MAKRRYFIGTQFVFGRTPEVFRSMLLSDCSTTELVTRTHVGDSGTHLVEVLEHARIITRAWKEAKERGGHARAGVTLHAQPACYHLRYTYGISVSALATVFGIPVASVHNYAAMHRMILQNDPRNWPRYFPELIRDVQERGTSPAMLRRLQQLLPDHFPAMSED